MNEVVETENKRVRRVTTDVVLPKDGGTVGLISLNVSGVDEVINYEVDFAKLPEAFVMQAVLSGMSTRLGIAYSGKTEPQEIVDAINKELANFDAGKFVSRNAADHTLKVPAIVLAWVTAVGKDATDKAVVAVYAEAWKNKSEAEKTAIKVNERVATVYAQLSYEKRMSKIGDSDSSVEDLDL
jgi:hypothetical protein